MDKKWKDPPRKQNIKAQKTQPALGRPTALDRKDFQASVEKMNIAENKKKDKAR